MSEERIEPINDKLAREAHRDLQDRGYMKKGFGEYRQRLAWRDEKRAKKLYEERKIKMR